MKNYKIILLLISPFILFYLIWVLFYVLVNGIIIISDLEETYNNRSYLSKLEVEFKEIKHPEKTEVITEINKDIILSAGGSAYGCIYYVFQIRSYNNNFENIHKAYKKMYPQYFNKEGSNLDGDNIKIKKLFISPITKIENNKIIFKPFEYGRAGVPIIEVNKKELINNKNYYFIGYGFSLLHNDFTGAECRLNYNDKLKLENYKITIE